MKKFLAKILAVAMILVTVICSIVPASAASKTAKTDSTLYYTITTGNRECTLTLKPSKGSYAQKYVNVKNSKKTKICTNSLYANFTVTLNGSTYTVGSKKVSVKLQKNTTYHISVRCGGPSGIYAASLPLDIWNWRTSGDKYWKTKPSLKLDTGILGPSIR